MIDYSCYITIENKLDCSLTFLDDDPKHGQWEVNPPRTIGAKTTSSQLHLKGGKCGSDGWVRYRVDLADVVDDSNKPVIRAHFACPTQKGKDDEFDISATARDGSYNPCNLFAYSNTDYLSKRDRPLKVTLTIGYNTHITTSSKLTSVSVPNPLVIIRNTKGVVNFKKNLVVWESDDIAKYEDNTDTKMVGSFYPVAFDVSSSSPTSPAVYIHMNVDDQMLGVPFFIYGGNDAADNVVSSDPLQTLILDTPGLQKIPVVVSPPWASDDTPWAVVGNIAWRIRVTSTNQIINMASTRLEFYAITKKLPSFYKNVVGVTLLRRFVVPLRDTNNSTSWIKHCCQQTFNDFSFLYDARNGRAGYAGSYAGGSFKLASYLNDIWTKAILNCYDQASIMQICLGLSPATKNAGYVFMRKYGWSVTTPLVGWGKSNNPLFLATDFNGDIICDNNASDRSYFDNHAFISLRPDSKDGIVDSCCGPYTGSLALQPYIDETIQTTNDTTLYKSTSTTPATASDTDFSLSGVTNLNGGTEVATQDYTVVTSKAAIGEPSTSPLLGTPCDFKGVQRMIDLATAPFPPPPECRSNAALADFFNGDIISSLGFSVKHTSIIGSNDGTDAEWVLGSRDRNDDVVVKLFIAADGPTGAVGAFANHLKTYSRALDSVFQAPASTRGVRGQLNLESVGASDGKKDSDLILLWVYGNVFVNIAHRFGGPHRDELHIHDLADKLHEYISEGAVPLDSIDVTVPKIREVSGPQGPVALGETFVVRVSVDDEPYTTVDCKVGNAVLMEHNKAERYFKFYGANVGYDTISFHFAHHRTLNPVSHKLGITVTET